MTFVGNIPEIETYLGRHAAVECPHCDITVSADSLWFGMFQDNADGFYLQILQCPRCETPVLVSRRVSPRFDSPDLIEIDVPQRQWPADPHSRRLSFDTPDSVQRMYGEALRCMRAGAYTAAAVMARSALEAAVLEAGGTGGPLFKSLENLRDSGQIDGRLYDWATAIRLTGNRAVHEVGPNVLIERQDGADLIALVEAFADYMFTFQRRYERFMRRQGSV